MPWFYILPEMAAKAMCPGMEKNWVLSEQTNMQRKEGWETLWPKTKRERRSNISPNPNLRYMAPQSAIGLSVPLWPFLSIMLLDSVRRKHLHSCPHLMSRYLAMSASMNSLPIFRFTPLKPNSNFSQISLHLHFPFSFNSVKLIIHSSDLN